MVGRYNYEELYAAAVAPDATMDDIDALGEWFSRYGDSYWRGEYYELDHGYRLYPVYEGDIENDQYDIVGWEIR